MNINKSLSSFFHYRRSLLLTISIFLLFNINFGQTNPIDSLKSFINTSEGEEKLKALMDISKIYLDISLDTSEIFAQEGIEIAQKIDAPLYEAIFLKRLGRSYFFRSNYTKSQEKLFEALKIFETIDDSLGQTNTIYGISRVYHTRELYDLALEYAEKGLNLAIVTNNSERTSAFYEQIGDIYLERDNDYDKFFAYYEKSMQHLERIDDEYAIAVTLTNLGMTYSRYGDYFTAKENLERALQIADKIEARNIIAGINLHSGINFFRLGEYKKSRQFLEKCFEQSQDKYKNFGKESLMFLAKVDSAEGNLLTAYNTHKKFHRRTLDIIVENSDKELAELESKYQNEKKQAKIEILEKDNEIQTLWRNSFIGAFVFAFILAGGLYNRYRYKNKTSKKLSELNNQLEGELKQAAEYIQSLLPPKLEEKIKTDWKFIPSAHLGGDSFGYNFLDENHFAFYLIDVSGHGVGAALLSTSVLNILKSKSLPDTDFYNPAEVLNNLNKGFNMEEHDDKYFALWYGVLDLSTYELVCASAFHPPAIGVVNGQSIKYGKKEMMIGAFQDYCYENAYYQLSKGESIFLFSDGCFEVETEEVNFEFNDFVEILHSAEQENNGSLQKIHSTLLSIMNSDKFVDDFSILKLSL